MKPITTSPFLILAFFLLSCSASRESTDTRNAIHGEWQLLTFVTEGGTANKDAIVFHEAPLHCFVGSMWKFDKNGTGQYSIPKNGDQCNAVNRDFRWILYYAKNEPGLVQVHRLDEKQMEIPESKLGSNLTVTALEKNNMQLRSEINVENKGVVLIYNFVRTNK